MERKTISINFTASSKDIEERIKRRNKEREKETNANEKPQESPKININQVCWMNALLDQNISFTIL